MTRAVPTGDLGLDLLLGGGWKLVERLPERHSTTVVVRGGPGAGKTLLAIQVALALAEALGGDVAVGCVEILPSEYLAQLQSARADIERARIVVLPEAASPSPLPRVFCGLLTDLDPAAPDLVASLESLGRDVVAAGGNPAVYVVDSLIEGYGIGESAPRASADAAMKFAVQGGRGLVLCEETRSEAATTWVFAADTVLELGVASRERGRWIEVRKHRFAASVSGRHELEIRRQGAPAVYPQTHAWVTDHSHEVLRAHGWRYANSRRTMALGWHPSSVPGEDGGFGARQLEGTFVLITSPIADLARRLAFRLLPGQGASHSAHDLFFELDPLMLGEVDASSASTSVEPIPTIRGATRALRWFIEVCTTRFTETGEKSRALIRRVILGDVRLVLASPDALEWVEAIRVFASLVAEAGWATPVIVFETQADTDSSTNASAILARYSDLQLHAYRNEPTGTVVTLTGRGRRNPRRLTWQSRLDDTPLPADLAALDRSAP
ncbi:MAG: hypothetical protein Q7V43_01160 [Myxococcales bacterium]|nr:hypothetical protein [Myxococcales bacterium]